MAKVDATVIKETKYISGFVIILSVLMQAVFLILNKWDYTVLLGNLFSDFFAVGNFYLMGLFVQKALGKEQDEAKKIIKASQQLRTLGMFVAIAVGVLVPCFNIISVVAPVFFPRIAISFRPLFKDKNSKDVIDK
ncbi:MAG: hypothetical protein IJC06_03500 [Clostridia bacterium]|nr:hypothetical protein [Clostridia bacterium]